MRLMERMKNCELLQKFYEEQNDLIKLVDKLVLDTVKKGSFRNNNMGGKHGTLEYRLICSSTYAQIKIFEPDVFVFEYSMDYEHDRWDGCSFFSNDVLAGINFGKVQDADKFYVQNTDRLKVMSYPILEEQYFQYLTLFDLSSEDLYKYFIDIQKEHQCALQLTLNDESGFDRFSEVINNQKDMDIIKTSLSLVEIAYRRTAGL